MTLKIPHTLLDQLRQRGEAAYPRECCGVLVGEFGETGGNTVKAVIECGNTRTDSPESRYNISPSELVRIQREALLTGHDIVGFYHSHPDHPARWSSTDLAEAHWTGCSYLVTSVEGGRAILTSSFLLLEGEAARRLVDEAIQVTAQ